MAIIWVAWVAWSLVAIRSDALEADRALRSVRSELDIYALLEGDGVEVINAAATRFESLDQRIESPLLAPLRAAPVLGRQLSAASQQSASAGAGLRAAADISEQLTGLVDASVQSGPGRITALREVEVVARRGRAAFDNLDAGPDQALLGQLADTRARIEEARVGALDALDRAATVSAALARFFEGPSDYLLLAANNAQMQNGQGMFLSAGVLHVEQGRLRVEPMVSTDGLPLSATPVSLDDDLAARWGWLDPNTDFRHLGLSHRFQVTGELAVDLWNASGATQVDGVLAIDPFLLQAFMEATGPIPTRTGEIDAEGVVRFALHDQYIGTTNANARRREQLGEVASAALNSFEKVDRVGPGFLQRMARAIGGRHLLGWAADDTIQAGWQAARIDGQISPLSAQLAVVNRSGNKLDWFMRTSSELTVTPVNDGYEAEMRITVDNATPGSKQPEYVVGPYPGSGLAAAEYLGLVTLNLPEGATRSRFDGVDRLAVSGGDGVNRTIATWIRVQRGETAELVARFHLPADMTSLKIEPSGRASPTKWSMGGAKWDDALGHTIQLPTR